jgi:elongation factor G
VEQRATSSIEAAVEHDEPLMEKYLAGEELSLEEISARIRKATIANLLVPVLCGASFKNKGVQALLDAVIDYLPAPNRGASDQGAPPASRRDVRHASGERRGAVLGAGVQDRDRSRSSES